MCQSRILHCIAVNYRVHLNAVLAGFIINWENRIFITVNMEVVKVLLIYRNNCIATNSCVGLAK